MMLHANQAYQAFSSSQPGISSVGDGLHQRETATYDEINDYANKHSSNDMENTSTGAYENWLALNTLAFLLNGYTQRHTHMQTQTNL